jgi:hypothetical protein
LALNAGVDSGWSFDIDNTGANGVLTATYVPTMNGGRVETIFLLEMDGGLDDQFETYSGDSGNPSVPVTVRTDDLGEPPIFGNEPGTMYLDSSNNAHPEADEVMLVQVGPGYTLEQNYIIETWVKPDADKFIFSGNKFNNTFIFSWWEILDWCGLPTAQTDQLNLFMRSDHPTWTRMAGGTYRNIFNQSEEDPTKAIPLDEYSHLAVVWEWDEETSTANFMYYLNGELMVSGSSDAPPYGELPEFFAIGNNSFSATDNEAELACGADINYDGGFSGWYDSFALSTFTGDFEGTADFVLLEQTFPTWAGYEIQDGQHVDTGDWMGWLSVASTPWVYVWNLASWAFVEEVTDDGAWFYITK